jgi:alkylhydroperoxidase family enzyme
VTSPHIAPGSRREAGLIILRVAHLRSCEYEFAHHVALSRRAGVHAADVTRVQDGPSAAGRSVRVQPDRHQ